MDLLKGVQGDKGSKREGFKEGVKGGRRGAGSGREGFREGGGFKGGGGHTYPIASANCNLSNCNVPVSTVTQKILIILK